MSDIEFFCPQCGGALVVDSAGAGRIVNCTLCSKPIQVPQPEVLPRAAGFKWACPHCGQHVEIPPEMMGTVTVCPSCGSQLQLPQAADEPRWPSVLPEPDWTDSSAAAPSLQACRRFSLVQIGAMAAVALLAGIAVACACSFIFSAAKDSGPQRTPTREPSAVTRPDSRSGAAQQGRRPSGKASDGLRPAASEPKLVKLEDARSDVARQLRVYLAAVAQHDEAAAKQVQSEACTADFPTSYSVLVQSGWRYDENGSMILRETVSADGSFAAITAAVVFQAEERAMLYHDDFYFAREAGVWKVLDVRQAVKQLNSGGKLKKADYVDNLAQAGDGDALLDAVKQGREPLVRLHLAVGAKASAAEKSGATALWLAVKSGNERIVGLLIEHGADVNAPGADDSNPLILAAREKREPILRLLLDKGADANAGPRGLMTALMTAAESGQESSVRLLLEKGADVNAKAKKQRTDGEEGLWTALMLAAEKGHEPIVRLLLDKGADINAKNASDASALLLAVYEGRESTVRLLIDKGAAFKAKEENALATAMQQLSFDEKSDGKYRRITLLLIEKGADPNVLMLNCNTKITALQEAISSGDDDLACLLIEKGADLRVRGEQIGDSLLRKAVFEDRLKVAERLIAKGADVQEKDKHGETVLSLALSMGHDDMARLLLKHGVRPGSRLEEKRVADLRRQE